VGADSGAETDRLNSGENAAQTTTQRSALGRFFSGAASPPPRVRPDRKRRCL